MKALYFDKHGSLDNLKFGELPDPVATDQQALVRVRAVALNYLDIWVRRGWPGLQLKLPHIGGSDIAGDIVSLPNDCKLFSIGQRVIIAPGFNLIEDEWTRRGEDSLSPGYRIIGEQLPGGLAEYVAVPVATLIPATPELDYPELAAPNLVAVTCWRMLFKQARLIPGETVLIVGSGGGVNSLSLQLAKATGCEVIVLAGSAEKATQSRKLGADSVIRYDQVNDWHKEVLNITRGRGVDLVIDNVGQATFDKSIKSVRRGGRIVTVGNTTGPEIAYDNRFIFSKQIAIIGSTMGSKQDLLDVLRFLQINRIKVQIDSVNPLKDGVKHFNRLETGKHFGKIVLTP